MARAHVVRVLLVGLATVPLAVVACVGDDPVIATTPDAASPASPDAATSTGQDAGTVPPADSGGGADTGPSCAVTIPTDDSPGTPVCPLDGGTFEQCSAGQPCCLDPGGNEYWLCSTDPQGDCIGGSTIYCNSPADCPGAQCCLTADVSPGCPASIKAVKFGTSNEELIPAACSSKCGSDSKVHVVCSGDGDCPQGQSCHPAELPYFTTKTTSIIGVCY
jgi:hypothetical protein